MPIPSVEPSPELPRELRVVVPDDAQDASYFAASDRIASLFRRVVVIRTGYRTKKEHIYLCSRLSPAAKLRHFG